jgi:DUF177 domain-containing protein
VIVAVDVDVRDLIDQPGSARSVHLNRPIPGLATEMAEVPADWEVEAELLLESVVEGILASGPVKGSMTLSCARCLKGFQSAFELGVQELFAPGAVPGDDEYPLGEGFVDLEPMIRDAVLLAMPFAPLCRPDCRGLCPRCGGDRNLGECACQPEADPRWSALASLELELPDLADLPDAPDDAP